MSKWRLESIRILEGLDLGRKALTQMYCIFHDVMLLILCYIIMGGK